jgi:endogenous inhibitor of DNA gyrase (YacG/DUF329 family)
MRLKPRAYEATKVESIKSRKKWHQCIACHDYIRNEQLWSKGASFGPVQYYSTTSMWGGNSGYDDRYFCTACCHQPIDVVRWIEGKKATNNELYELSKKQHVKNQLKAKRKTAAAKRKRTVKRAAKKGGKNK